MKKIILTLLPVFFLLAAFYDKQTITITGNVMDQVGAPVPFAAITCGHSTSIADGNGSYQITVNENEQYLSFDAVGFVSLKVKINKQKVINVIMTHNQSELTTVIVTGVLGSRAKSKNLRNRYDQSANMKKGFYSPASPLLKRQGGISRMMITTRKNTATLSKMVFTK